MKVSVKRWLVAAAVSVGLGSTAGMLGSPTSSAGDSSGAVEAAHDTAALPACCALAGGWELLFTNPGR